MVTGTDFYELNHLEFESSSLFATIAHTLTVALAQQSDQVIECCLTFEVSPGLYHHIDANALFNLKPEFRTPLINGDFLPDRPIQLEVTLHRDLLPLLLEHAKTAEEAAAYLLTLSQQKAEQVQPNASEGNSAETIQNTEAALNLLLNTESWFCLSVKQIQETGETGYTTFWNYVNPATLNQPGASSEQIAEGITNFFKDWTAANLTAATQDITEELFKGVTTLFDGFDTWLDNAFSKDEDDSEEDTDDDDESILETVIDFFTEDDWTFTKLQGQSTLQVACQGENGRWNCYAQAREDQEQFVFYSIYPDIAPEDKRLTMAEFLTRANYGLIIGNFEMDFDDGEIRYKTSIDVEGDLLTTDLIKQLVYANIMMMDHYLPGIQAVMDSRLSAAEAISQIESQTAIATTNTQDDPEP
ncbi:MAG: YbjN domain-containing protein [Drouetiella hepatica Uher 2000/2452]|jgi:hypothetical protein|uniref:YbjN domain-containing protein n=1 Tax=Drouetiella hepatica Uher 2000/2452 TaxID=904376 RepID=A0A951UMT8_9CYAN|nr:YbjN domain-containing protein [Drouetiella hepatica Uher 2000/2452]